MDVNYHDRRGGGRRGWLWSFCSGGGCILGGLFGRSWATIAQNAMLRREALSRFRAARAQAPGNFN
eukprot:781439-Pyramimonas_sp.AAC.1